MNCRKRESPSDLYGNQIKKLKPDTVWNMFDFSTGNHNAHNNHRTIDDTGNSKKIIGSCPSCKFQFDGSSCSFCVKSICYNLQCLQLARRCFRCSGIFCTTCTSVNYQSCCERFICFDCSYKK